MIVPTNMPDDVATQATSLWVLWQETPDDPEITAQVTEWREADPSHDAAWHEVCDLNQLFEQMRPPASTARPRPQIRQRNLAPPPQHKRSMRRFAGLAAAASVGMAMLLGPDLLTRLQADHFTGRSETRAVALVDGSTVYLGADSAIRVDVDQNAREIELLQGEAFFEVTHDPTRPFRVTSGTVSATALGTSFLVQHFDKESEVLVKTGKVLVHQDVEAWPGETLASGQWIRSHTNGEIESGLRAPEAATAFLQNRLVAMDRPVAEMLDSLQRHFAGKIIVLPANLQGKNITGVYDATRPLAAAQAMVQPFDGQVWMLSDWVLVVSF